MSFLQATFDGVEIAFAAASEFVSVGTYLGRTGNESYDIDADTMNPIGTSIPNVRFLPTSVQDAEREASPVAVSDLKILIPGKDLGTFVPSTNDKLQMAGFWYNVVAVKPVPGKALWIVFVRAA